jgi:hypothetical protein
VKLRNRSQRVRKKSQRRHSSDFRLLLRQPHTGVNQRDACALLMNDHRIQIHFRDTRRGFGERPEREEQTFERRIAICDTQ